MPPSEPDTSEQEGIARRLREAIGDAPIREVADRTSMHQESVRRYLGTTMPSVEFILSISRWRGISVNWLLLGVGEKHLTSLPRPLGEVELPALLDEFLSRISEFESQVTAAKRLAAALQSNRTQRNGMEPTAFDQGSLR